jgi:hypothetical protein
MFRHVMMRGEWSVIHLTGLLTKPWPEVVPSMGVLDARCFRYDIENDACHGGWYTEMSPRGNIVDRGHSCEFMVHSYKPSPEGWVSSSVTRCKSSFCSAFNNGHSSTCSLWSDSISFDWHAIWKEEAVFDQEINL